MMRKRFQASRIVVPLSLVVLVVFWATVIPRGNRDAPLAQEARTPTAVDQHGAYRQDLIRTSATRNQVIVVVDDRSGTILHGLSDLQVSHNGGWERISLDDPVQVSNFIKVLEDNPQEASLRYVAPSLPPGLEVECPPGRASLEEQADRLLLQVPALPWISVTAINGATSQVIPDANIRVFVVDREHWQECAAEVAADDEHRLSPLPSNIPNPILARYRHFSEARGYGLVESMLTFDEDTRIYSGGVLASGLAVLSVSVPGFASVMILDELHPLKTSGHVIACDPKPVIQGRVSSLLPLDGCTVSVAVRLDNDGTDFALQEHMEGFSLSGKRLQSGEVLRVARTDVALDEQGRFRKRLPVGKEYLVEIRGTHDGGYLSEELSLQQVLDSELNELEWTLGDSQETFSGIEFEVIPPAGVDVKNARLLVAPKDDQPWFRVFPKVYCDEDGIAHFPWANPGDELFVTVFLDHGQGSKGFPSVIAESNQRLDMRSTE